MNKVYQSKNIFPVYISFMRILIATKRKHSKELYVVRKF